MKMLDPTTIDLAEFGARERAILCEILNSWIKYGLPEDFINDEVRPMFNKNSGCVFLTNSEYQSAMMNGDHLETWYNCFYCGEEGFKEDCRLNDEGCEKCHPTAEKEGDDL